MYVVLAVKHKQIGDWVVIDNAHMCKQSSSAQHSDGTLRDGTLRGGARGRDSVQRGGAHTRHEKGSVHSCSRHCEEKPRCGGVSAMALTAASSNPIDMEVDI